MFRGDSAWALVTKLTEADAASYFADRAKLGYTTVFLSALVAPYVFGNSTDTTYDGIGPFNTFHDLSTPNPAYFQRLDDMINLAAQNNLLVMLDPIEIAGWYDAMVANGPVKCFNYGVYMANRYKSFPNVIWSLGNDYQSWPSYDTTFDQVAAGIASVIPGAIQSIELNYITSMSTDDANWNPWINLNLVYTYFPTYAQDLLAYNHTPNEPYFMGEASYEQENNGNTDGGSIENLRRQEWWTALSGAAGQLYGSYWTDRFADGWQSNLDTLGAVQFGYFGKFFTPLAWWNLVPDQSHQFVVSGNGIPYTNLSITSATGTVSTDTYLTAGLTSDGTLGVVYMPTVRSISVNLALFSAQVIVQWFDPSTGVYTPVLGSPFANSGSQVFTPPGNDSDGNGDWVLLFRTTP